jgi:hypothetical protein
MPVGGIQCWLCKVLFQSQSQKDPDYKGLTNGCP